MLVHLQILRLGHVHFRADLRVKFHLGAVGIRQRDERAEAFAFDCQTVLQGQLDGVFERQLEHALTQGWRRVLGGRHLGLLSCRGRLRFLLPVKDTGRQKRPNQKQNDAKTTDAPSEMVQFQVGARPATHASSPSFVSSSPNQMQSTKGPSPGKPKRSRPGDRLRSNTRRLGYQAATGFPGDPVAPMSFSGDHAKANSYAFARDSLSRSRFSKLVMPRRAVRFMWQ